MVFSENYAATGRASWVTMREPRGIVSTAWADLFLKGIGLSFCFTGWEGCALRIIGIFPVGGKALRPAACLRPALHNNWIARPEGLALSAYRITGVA